MTWFVTMIPRDSAMTADSRLDPPSNGSQSRTSACLGSIFDQMPVISMSTTRQVLVAEGL
jgi:hypothetical protein